MEVWMQCNYSSYYEIVVQTLIIIQIRYLFDLLCIPQLQVEQ
jgi:hypothetical protein